MKKWKKVTLWVAGILIILVVGGLFAANYAVDKVLNSMVGMSVDDLIEEKAGSEGSDSGEAAGSNGASDDLNSSDPGSSDQPSSSNTDDTTSSNGGGQNSSTGASNGSDQPVETTQPSTDSGYSAEISTDKAKEVEENITIAEKAKVVTTLMGSLSASDISALQKLASGGLSVDEKREARALLLEKLTEDQYNELIAIAAKHGLSQGKAYAEVKGE